MENIEINLRIDRRALTLDQFQSLVIKASDQGITKDEFILNAILEKLDGPAFPVFKPKPPQSPARAARRKRRTVHV